jgi:hypothetical protein
VRLSELIAGLEREQVQDLALRVIPGAHELDPNLRAFNLETVLAQTGHVEQTLLGRRPPVASLLLRLLEAKGNIVTLEDVRGEVAAQTERWCRQVTAGELANRIPDRSLIYRRMLEAAWHNDHVLDDSEVRMLRLLREELGLLRIEHYLLAHHASIQPYWKTGDPLDVVVEALATHGVIFRVGSGAVALPDELVPHVRRSLGVSMSRDAARRLLHRLDSGTHLRSALADHELATSGSKPDRVERIVEHFVPMPRVVDTLHIVDARELARSLGLAVSGSKEDLVQRIVGCFACDGDLAAEAVEEEPEQVQEERVLSRSAFAALFGGFKGHQLQQLLMALDLRHSGSKEVRIATLWESPFSEHTALAKLKSPDLDRLLLDQGLSARGSKADKIARLVDAFRETTQEETPASTDVDSTRGSSGRPPRSAIDELAAILAGIELSSKSPTRFDPVREYVMERLRVVEDEVGIKYLGDPKNHRNRIGEALRGRPELLLLLAPMEECEAVIEAARSRLGLSRETHFMTLLVQESEPTWSVGSILSTGETQLLGELIDLFPSAAVDIVELPAEAEHEPTHELVTRVEHELADEWPKIDAAPEERVTRALLRALQRPDAIIRTKHISDSRNVGNRISEAIGAGCGALVLVVAAELADVARAEASRQLTGSHEPAIAVVIAETNEGGYAPPAIVTGDGAAVPEAIS